MEHMCRGTLVSHHSTLTVGARQGTRQPLLAAGAVFAVDHAERRPHEMHFYYSLAIITFTRVPFVRDVLPLANFWTSRGHRRVPSPPAVHFDRA